MLWNALMFSLCMQLRKEENCRIQVEIITVTVFSDCDWTAGDEQRLRETISKLKVEHSRVRNTVVQLERPHVDILKPELPLPLSEIRKLDLETAVLMQASVIKSDRPLTLSVWKVSFLPLILYRGSTFKSIWRMNDVRTRELGALCLASMLLRSAVSHCQIPLYCRWQAAAAEKVGASGLT